MPDYSRPKWLAHLAGRSLGVMLGEIVITKDEIKGLERNLLVSNSMGISPCRTKLTEWLEHNGSRLGLKYASETARHYRRRRNEPQKSLPFTPIGSEKDSASIKENAGDAQQHAELA